MKKLKFLFFVVTLVMPLSVYAEEAPTEIPDTIEQPAPTEVIPPVAEPVLGPPALIVVHRVSNVCFVYDENNQLLRGFIVSTGKPGHETPLGTYQIYQHATGSGYHPMVDGTYGRWCMRFKQGGYMFHSVCYTKKGAAEPISEEVVALGTSVSRGCVRLNVADAEWLYKNTPNGCLVAILDD